MPCLCSLALCSFSASFSCSPLLRLELHQVFRYWCFVHLEVVSSLLVVQELLEHPLRLVSKMLELSMQVLVSRLRTMEL